LLEVLVVKPLHPPRCSRNRSTARADIEFSTPDNEEHWVILVPMGQIVGLVGEELAAALLRTRHADSGDPRVIRHLGSLVVRVVAKLRAHSLHRDLRRASSEQTTVTEAATHWGFFELGRTAVEYRELFGEPPSTTLARSGRLDYRRLADALAFS
jgi:hypothetical protein